MRVAEIRVFFDVDGESPDFNDSINETGDSVLMVDIVEDFSDREFLASERWYMGNKIKFI